MGVKKTHKPTDLFTLPHDRINVAKPISQEEMKDIFKRDMPKLKIKPHQIN